MKKQILRWLIAIAFVLCLLPVTVMAEETEQNGQTAPAVTYNFFDVKIPFENVVDCYRTVNYQIGELQQVNYFDYTYSAIKKRQIHKLVEDVVDNPDDYYYQFFENGSAIGLSLYNYDESDFEFVLSDDGFIQSYGDNCFIYAAGLDGYYGTFVSFRDKEYHLCDDHEHITNYSSSHNLDPEREPCILCGCGETFIIREAPTMDELKKLPMTEELVQIDHEHSFDESTGKCPCGKYEKTPTVTSSHGYTGMYDGQERSISVSASYEGDNGAETEFAYQWYRGGKSEANKIENATSAVLMVKEIADSGMYYCKVATKNVDNCAGWSSAIPVHIYFGIKATYGDIIPFTAEIEAGDFDPDDDEMWYYCNYGESYLIAYLKPEDGKYVATLEYDTSDRRLVIGENVVIAVYYGYVNLNGSNSDTNKVILNPKTLTITAKNQVIGEGESVEVGIEQVEVAGLVGNDELAEVILEVAPDGKLIPSGAVIINGETDVTEYYDIQYEDGALKDATYTVTLNTNGGTIISGDLSGYVYGVGAVLPSDVTKDGYRFAGWYDNEEFAGSPVSKITAEDSGNKTFFSKWTLNEPDVDTSEGYTGIYDGEIHYISVEASHDANPDFTYQWYKDGQDEENKIGGAQTANYGVKDVEDSGTYYCKVTAFDTVSYDSENKLTSEAWSEAITVTITEPVYEIELSERREYEFASKIEGYSVAPELEVTVENTGNMATGELTVELSGDDAECFSLTTGAVFSLDIDETYEFTVSPLLGLSVGTYEATVNVSGDNDIEESFDVSFRVKEVPAYGIALSKDSYEFEDKTEGYTETDELEVTVENIGNMATGELIVELSGDDEDCFSLTTGAVFSLDIDETYEFTVSPQLGLLAGIYEAVVTVSGENGIEESLDISFTVNEIPVEFTLTFKANGGKGKMEPIIFTTETETEIPVNEFYKTGYEFVGWNTKADGRGTSYSDGDSITVSEDIKLYAQWEKIVYSYDDSYSEPIYKVEKAEKTENGSVETDFRWAEKGDTVTVKVTHDEGYELGELVIKDKDGSIIAFTDNGDGTYSFDMPAGKVTVDAKFRPVEKEEKIIVLVINSFIAEVFGEKVVNDVAPVIKNDRTMLPVRFIAEALGAKVEWDDEADKVTIIKGDNVIEIYIGLDVALVNNYPIELDSAAYIEYGRTYLPVRFVAELLDATVLWDEATQYVTISG